jgi:hypothetical protein
MINQVAIIVTIAAMMISIPVTYFSLPQAQGTSSQTHVPSPSNYFAPHYKTGGAHSSAISTTNPTGSTYSGHHGSSILLANPAGSNMTTGSNTTGAAGNTTGGTHRSYTILIPRANPAGWNPFDPP